MAPHTTVVDYMDFGLACTAFDLLGPPWYQWNGCGDCHGPSSNGVRVVVYRGIKLDKVKERYPVIPEKEQDYRYVEYSKAINHLDETAKLFRESETPDLKLEHIVLETKRRIINDFNETK